MPKPDRPRRDDTIGYDEDSPSPSSRHAAALQNVALDAFFSRLCDARSGTLMLDYDGTLAPFQVDRHRAFPYEGVASCLRHLHDAGQTRIIIVSGRSIADLKPLMRDIPSDEVWGSHGWEKLSNGNHSWRALDDHVVAALADAAKFVGRQGWDGLEKKPTSVAFHVRGLVGQVARERRAIVVAAWSAICEDSQLAVHVFDGGVELRPHGFNKGSVVKEVLAVSTPGALVAYLGDDITDEDAFKAIIGSGLAVLVRPEWRPTLAEAWITPPAELIHFFQRWLDAVVQKGN